MLSICARDTLLVNTAWEAVRFPNGAYLAINLTKLLGVMWYLVPNATVTLVNKTAVAKAEAYCSYKCRSTQRRL